MKVFTFISLVTLILMVSLSGKLLGQSSNRMNVAISKPTLKSTFEHTKGNTYLELVMAEAISESSDLVNYIDRNDLDLITSHREDGFKNLDIDAGSAQMQGIEYLIESKVINFREKWTNHCHTVKEEYMDGEKIKTKTTLDTCKHTSVRLSFEMELEMISVETGEVISKRKITPSAWSYEGYLQAVTDADKNRMRLKAYNDMKHCFSIIWRNNLLKILQPDILVIDIPNERKGKAQKIYIAGGKDANYPNAAVFEVVKKYEEKIGDEIILREEKIGEAALEAKYYEYSLCDVKKGKEEIFQAMQAGDKIYCKPGKMLKLESCQNYTAREKKISAIKSTDKLIKLEDKNKESEKNSRTKTTPTTAKKEPTKPKEIQIKARNPSTGKKKSGGND